MTKFYRNAHQQLLTSIAILAVMLLFIAPVISKSLLEQHLHQNAASQASDLSVGEQAESQQSIHVYSMMMPEMDEKHNMPMAQIACGYCDLLIHVTLLLWVFIPFIWLLLLVSRAPPHVRCYLPLVVDGFYSCHLSRAPPRRFHSLNE